MTYREPYPTWILRGMDGLAAGILLASFRDAWKVVSLLGDPTSLANGVVAGAVVLAIDASILLLEQARSLVKLRGGATRAHDVWVTVLILISAMLNIRYLTQSGTMLDRSIGAVLGLAIPSTIAVLGLIKGDMLAYNAQCRAESTNGSTASDPAREPDEAPATSSPLFKIRRAS